MSYLLPLPLLFLLQAKDPHLPSYLAEPLLERLALHELIDPRIEDSFDTYELYHMVKAAYLCVRSKAEMRPSMGEVVRLLEGDHVQDLVQQFMPHYAERLA